MNGKQLKNSILQWAIQGKLVPQDPNDEPASVLLERIREEKARLVKEKKIKKDKNESIIYRGDDNSYYEKFLATGEVKCIDEEIPFEIPEGWEWCRLGILFSHCTGKALNGINKKGKLYTYITTSNLYWDRFEISTLKEMFFTDEELDKCTATKGDLLVCEGGDIGRSAIWNYDYDIRIQNHIHKLRAYLPLCTRFFYYVMFLYKGIGNIGGKGIGIQGLSSGALHNIVLPLPSIQEQERIVAKIETIMPLAVKYEKSQNELNRLNDNIYTRLRKSILQEAIQGKLVPQDPNDEPASALLERICEEKQRLLKKGRLKKKEITESVIFKGEDNKYFEKVGNDVLPLEEEIPFELPDSWTWVRLNDICEYIQRGKSPKYSEVKKYPVVAQKCNQWSGFSLEKALFIDPNTLSSYGQERLLQHGDLLWNSTGLGTLGRMAIYNESVNPYGIAVADSHVTVIRPIKSLINFEYLYLYFSSNEVQSVIEDKSDGSTKQKELATKTIKSYLVPLPPLSEQHRIVAKYHSVASIMRG